MADPVFKDMKVEGYDIGSAILEAAYGEMRKRERMTFLKVQRDLINAGANEFPSYRAADRLLQKLRRDGLIAFKKGYWTWVA